MSSPLLELQHLLAGRVSVAGRVISMSNGLARVATAGGVVEVPYDGSVGDRVTVVDGRAVRVQDVVDAPTFFV
ncbi:conserved hypothetical protein [uncultured Gammaproteobacteria bacterium]